MKNFGRVEAQTMVCIVAMLCIVVAYAVYVNANPGADGMIFGSVLAGITALAVKAYEKSKRWW